MAAQLQITVRDMPHSAALEARVRRKVAGLEKLHPRITAFHVTFEAPHHRHRKGSQFSVRLDIKVPGSAILVTRDHDEDIYVALRDACQVARRQLIEHAERGQGADRALRGRTPRVAVEEAPDNE